MKKSDLHTGMKVTLRNGEFYYAMLCTGLSGEQENILVHKVGNETGWMPLNRYNDDLAFHDDDDDPIFPSFSPEDDDSYWDIVKVEAVREPAYLFDHRCYKTVWERKC